MKPTTSRELDAIPIRHFFGAGTCIKETFLLAGETLVQHRHHYDHLSYLVSGTVEVAVDGQKRKVVGPACMTIEAGKHHGVKALTDAVWLCIHGTDATDADMVDQVVIAPSDPAEVRAVFEVLT